MTNTLAWDGIKAVPLSKLPEAAWSGLGGGTGNENAFAAFKVVPTVNRCLNLRANAVASMPFSVYPLGSDDPVDLSKPDVNSELRWIRSQWKRILWGTEGALCAEGRTYTVKEANAVGRNLSPRWLVSRSIKDIYGPGGIVGFERRLSMANSAQKVIPIPPEQMVATYLLSLETELGAGWPPAMAGIKAALGLEGLQEFINLYFKRGAIKATQLTAPNDTQPAEIEKLEKWWKRFFRGIAKAWETAVVSADVKPVVVGEGVGDLHNKELTDGQREDVCIAMGVPLSLVASKAANFATAERDTLNFYLYTVNPQCDLIAESFNRQLFNPLGYELRFEPESLEPFQKAMLDKMKGVKEIVGKPVLTVNEGRELLGYEAIDETEITPPPAPTVPPANEDPTKEKEVVPAKAYDGERMDLARWEGKALKRVGKATPFDSAWIAPEVRAWVNAGLEHATSRDEVREAFKIDLSDFGDLESRLATELENLLASGRSDVARAIVRGDAIALEGLVSAVEAALLVALTEAATDAVDGLEIEVGATIDPGDFAVALSEWANPYVAEVARTFSETSKALVEEVIRKYRATPGMTRAQVEALLEGTFGVRRATAIAITEITRAANQATRQYQSLLQAAGIEMIRVWRTNNDSLTCPICGPLNGKDESEWVERFPGGPPAHPRCRCFTTLRLATLTEAA